jgi:hypothetical protein
VPDLSAPSRWKKTAQGKVIVTPDNFIRAESNVYMAAQVNELNAYSINSVTGQKSADGAITIQFGACSKGSPNCLPVTKGWNYMVRLYRPRQEILSGTWSFPVAAPIQ